MNLRNKSIAVRLVLKVNSDAEYASLVGWAGYIVKPLTTICKQPDAYSCTGNSINELIEICVNNNINTIYISDASVEEWWIRKYIVEAGYKQLDSEIAVTTSKQGGVYAYYMEKRPNSSCWYSMSIKVPYIENGKYNTKIISIWDATNITRSNTIDLSKTFIPEFTNLVSNTAVQCYNDNDIQRALVTANRSSLVIAVAIDDINNRIKDLIDKYWIEAGSPYKLDKKGRQIKPQAFVFSSKRTISGYARKAYLASMHKVNLNAMMVELDSTIENNIRNAYRGGITWCKSEIIKKHCGHGWVADILSMYPAVCTKYSLPCGKPEYYKGDIEYTPFKDMLYIAHVRVEASVKKDHIPCISTHGSGTDLEGGLLNSTAPSEYLDHELWLTNYDIELLFNQYNVKSISYIDGYAFNNGDDLFKKYMLPLYDVKCTSTGAVRNFAKLMIDAITGAFGIDNTHYSVTNNDDLTQTVNKPNTSKGGFGYLPAIVFITAIGRYNIVLDGQDHYDKLLYIDTDSLHLLGSPSEYTDIDIDFNKKRLGAYKVEEEFDDAIYIKSKCYAHLTNNELDIKATGLASDAHGLFKSLDQFASGEVVFGNPKPVKRNKSKFRILTTFKIN